MEVWGRGIGGNMPISLELWRTIARAGFGWLFMALPRYVGPAEIHADNRRVAQALNKRSGVHER